MSRLFSRERIAGAMALYYLATTSFEDIVIAKLHSFRDLDRQDLISDEVLSNIDWERLKHLALDEDEAKSSALNEQSYKIFLYDYNEYVRVYGPHEEIDV